MARRTVRRYQRLIKAEGAFEHEGPPGWTLIERKSKVPTGRYRVDDRVGLNVVEAAAAAGPSASGAAGDEDATAQPTPKRQR